MYNKQMIKKAIKILETPPDGSNANFDARVMAKALLRTVANDFRDFANLKPESAPAKYLFAEAERLENISKSGN